MENDQNQDDGTDDQAVQPGMGPMNGNFMNFGGGDMNQMQMMMAMQNGMNPASFGSFPMMGKLAPLAPRNSSTLLIIVMQVWTWA